MIRNMPEGSAARAERKADLLLASRVLRGQAMAAVDDLGQRADGLALRAIAWRDLFSNPVVLAAAGGGAAFFAAIGKQKRGRLWRGLRWAWLTWRVLRRRKR